MVSEIVPSGELFASPTPGEIRKYMHYGSRQLGQVARELEEGTDFIREMIANSHTSIPILGRALWNRRSVWATEHAQEAVNAVYAAQRMLRTSEGRFWRFFETEVQPHIAQPAGRTKSVDWGKVK